ncbi:MAG: hypothetical protein LBR98_10325 [Syntrophomonadaceae bacterium]|jgi:hypothetical protein|nr:hypothetical protein [Syntrophomonadaceae bacterium]
MLLKLIFDPIFSLLNLILQFIPKMESGEYLVDISGYVDVIVFVFVFFPASLFTALVGNVLFWLEVQLGWSVIEWIYKKIPGVS